MKNKITFLFAFFFVFLTAENAFSQSGISVSPPKIYFNAARGETQTLTVQVSNPSGMRQNYSVYLGYWERDSLGSKKYYNKDEEPTVNNFSVADLIRLSPLSFDLNPGEKRDVFVTLAMPANASTDLADQTRWAMLFIKENKPNTITSVGGTTGKQSQMIIEYQIGVHVYQTPPYINEPKEVEILDLTQANRNGENGTLSGLNLKLENKSRMISESFVSLELLNLRTGEVWKGKPTSISIFPKARRIVFLDFPKDLKPGTYSATTVVDSGANTELSIAEIQVEKRN